MKKTGLLLVGLVFALLLSAAVTVYADGEAEVKAFTVTDSEGEIVAEGDTDVELRTAYAALNDGDTVTITVKPKPGYAIARYTVRGVDITLGENGTFTFVMPDNDVNIRIEFSTIDNVEPNKEITAYIIFGVFIVLVAAALLFVNNGDGSGDSPGHSPSGGRQDLRWCKTPHP